MALTINALQVPTDEDLVALAGVNPGYRFERDAEGRLIVSPPSGFQSGAQSLEVASQLAAWARRDGRGVCTDTSAGFRLPDGSLLQPDATWTRRERLRGFDPTGFAPLAPDVVIEVRSPSDSLADQRAKIDAYLRNGTQLAILVDPLRRVVEISRRDAPRIENDEDAIVPGPPLDGFVLDARSVYDILEG